MGAALGGEQPLLRIAELDAIEDEAGFGAVIHHQTDDGIGFEQRRIEREAVIVLKLRRSEYRDHVRQLRTRPIVELCRRDITPTTVLPVAKARSPVVVRRVDRTPRDSRDS